MGNKSLSAMVTWAGFEFLVTVGVFCYFVYIAAEVKLAVTSPILLWGTIAILIIRAILTFRVWAADKWKRMNELAG